MNSTVDYDFYAAGFEDLSFKISFTAAIIAVDFSGLLLCGSLIYYEMNISDIYRTLVNKLYARLLCLFIGVLCPSNVWFLARIWFGPNGIAFCRLMSAIVSFMTINICLILSESVLVKYAYCCYFGSVGLLNEDFLMLFSRIGKVSLLTCNRLRYRMSDF